MLPQSLLTLTLALLPLSQATFSPLAEASNIALKPQCAPTMNGYLVGNVTQKSQDFCTKLSANNFTTDMEMYGLPIISFGFIAASTGNKCDLSNCQSSYGTLIKGCQMNNHTIYGSGSLDAGCGIYNFSIWDNTTGTATSTLVVPSQTGKPAVGSTALGTSGAGVVSVSAGMLVGLATFVAWYL